MIVYVAIVSDRHVDPVVRAFEVYTEAENWAWFRLWNRVAHSELVKVLDPPLPNDCVFYAAYGDEADYAAVYRVSVTPGSTKEDETE